MSDQQAEEVANQWELGKDERMPDDPLLGCLILLTKINNQPYSEKALTAKLPLVNNRLTPTLFVRAAERASMSAKIVKRDLNKIHQVVLPAVLLLNDEQVCILLDVDHEGHAQIMLPETDSGITKTTIEALSENYSGYTIFVKPEYDFGKRSSETIQERPKNWFWSVVLKSWPIYSEVLVASFFINMFGIAVPLFVMNVYDRVVPNYAIETMWVLAIGVFIVFLFDFLLKNLRSYFVDMAGKNVDMRLSSSIYSQILGVRMDNRPQSVGAFVNTVQSFESFRDFITSTTVVVLVDLPFVFLYIFIISLIGGSLFWVPVAIIPIVILVGLLLQFPLIKLTEQSFIHANEKQAALIESLGAPEVVKTTCSEGVLQRRWEQILALAARVGVKLRFVSNLGINFSTFAQQFASVTVVIFGVYKISEGDLTIGALIACTILTGRALAPMSQVAALLTRYYHSAHALRAVDTVMHLPVERDPGKSYLHRKTLQGNIELRNVSFAYPGSEVAAINGVSLKIRAGEKVGIIGRVGSGKTTIAKLLLGLYQPSEGGILLDGVEAQQIDPAEMRHYMGYVPQDVVLFYGDVKQNICMGAPYVDEPEIIKAASIAGVTNFVSQHPQGFEMPVGERGVQLSGGQRQSIAVARSLLLDPPILLFDEPTNSMDDSTEALLRKNLKTYLTNKKTLLLVTHKSSMLSLVDRLIVLEGGKVIADGPKESVLQALAKGTGNLQTVKGKPHE